LGPFSLPDALPIWLDQWTDAWIETAQRFLGDYRRQISGSQRTDAAQARLLAGLCYHIAQLAPGPDERTLEHCQATAATLVRQALPDVLPHARRLDIPWRNHALPSILIPGPDQQEPSGLVVVFNGTSTTKEELLRWIGPLDKAGLATLLVDTPGTGEARHLGPPSADHVDLMDGVFDVLRSYHAIDIHKVGLLGISLGGNIALRCLAHDRRIAGAALVTPPFDPSQWIGRSSPLVQDELSRLFQTDDPIELERVAASFSLADVVPHVQRPTLILGGGRDLVIPPAESTRLAAALGPLSTLVWYAEGGHGLYGQAAAWTMDAGYWLDAVQRRQSTRVDDMAMLATEWRKALYQKPEPETDWDDSMESARLLSPEEAAQARETAQAMPPLDDEYSRAFSERAHTPRDRRSREREVDDSRF
jgi:pimeloyl-ACP methyl ester carboxylesterase